MKIRANSSDSIGIPSFGIDQQPFIFAYRRDYGYVFKVTREGHKTQHDDSRLINLKPNRIYTHE